MIGFFPVPYPDEILYSVFARYHSRSGHKSLAATTENLFGHNASRIVIDLPNKLGFLANQLPEGNAFTAERLIDQTTLFSFYAPFLPPDRAKELRKNMIERSPGGAIHGRLGILTSNIEVEFLRYCSVCTEENFSLYGEPYWHRTHQLPGILVCPHHSVFLENSTVKCAYNNRRETLIAAHKKIRKTTLRYCDSDNPDHLIHLYLAQQGYWLLQQANLMNCGPIFFRKRFLNKLFEKNLATANGTVHITELEKEFSEHFSSDFLSLLSSKLEGNTTWLRRLVQATVHFQHPIRNLLLLYFLQISVENFLEISETFFPFGKPPFPCLNPASDHYQELRIEKLTIKKIYHKESGISAVFKCDCGFVYRRSGYNETGERTYEYDSIVSFGNVFEKKIIELNSEGLSAKQIGSKLNISGNVVKSQLKKLLEVNNHSLSNDGHLPEFNKNLEKRNHYRSQWKLMQQLNPKLNRTELRKLNPSIGNWLYIRDMAWLDENSPARQISKKRKNRVDWKTRDREFSLKAEKLALELLSDSGKPVRVTATGLAKRLNFNYLLSKRRDCIPETLKTLKKYAESTEDFIARRIYYAADCFIGEKRSATYWQLIMRAALQTPHLVKLPKVQKAIKDSLAKIENLRDLGWKTQQ
jgi:hypothetical protein